MVVGVAAGEDRLARAAEKTLAQGFVALQRGQQVGAVVIAGRMLVKRSAVVHHRPLQVLAKQPQALDQRMNGPQHGAGDIVGIHLVAAHHQQGRALQWRGVFQQQAVGAQQAVCCRVMGFTA
ncbi:hypothetical protein D3C78_930160 [compost metagenome]